MQLTPLLIFRQQVGVGVGVGDGVAVAVGVGVGSAAAGMEANKSTPSPKVNRTPMDANKSFFTALPLSKPLPASEAVPLYKTQPPSGTLTRRRLYRRAVKSSVQAAGSASAHLSKHAVFKWRYNVTILCKCQYMKIRIFCIDTAA